MSDSNEQDNEKVDEAAAAQAEANKTTAQRDMERRLATGNAPEVAIVTRQPGEVEASAVDGYLGTDPVYQNFANDTEEPLQSEEGPEADAEELHVRALVAEATDTPDDLKEAYADRSLHFLGGEKSEEASDGKSHANESEEKVPEKDAPVKAPAKGRSTTAKDSGDQS